MTITDRPDRVPSRRATARRRPVWMHAVGLSLVLVALLPVVGTSGAFMPDEGAAVIQARSLASGEGWIVEHPVPAVDAEGRYYPLALGQSGSRGVAPLGKHPLYPLLLAGAYRVGGVTAMFLLSLAGTVAAAAVAAALARRLEPALAGPAVWAVGLASPLVFDGYLLVAHSLAAAAVAGTMLATIVAVERRSRWAVLAVVPGVVVAVLLRNEALLWAGALTAVVTAVGAIRRDVTTLAVGAVVAVAAAAAHLAERVWIAQIVGTQVGVPAAPFRHGGEGFLDGRVQGVVLTWLTPSQSGSATVVVALMVMVACIVLAAVRARARPGDGQAVALPAAAAAVAAVLAVVVEPGNIVPGLLIAFPLLGAGLLAVDRRQFASLLAVLAGGTTALFTLAVMATQYSTGGTGEWGGRYFAVGIPVAVPVLLHALFHRGRRLPRATAVRAVAALAVCSLALTAMAVASHRAKVRSSTALAASVVRAARAIGEDRPVVVTTDVILPRLAWAAFDDVRWVHATPGDVDDAVAALRQAGIRRFGLVTATPERERRQLPGAAIRTAERLDGTALAMLLVDAPG